MTFQSLLPDSSSLFERALEDVFGRSLEAIEPELIKTFWDPDRIPAEHMSVLAHALSVDLWDDRWDELKKRSVIRRWVELEFAKGTYAGFRDFIDIAGGKLEQVLIPPGGFFVGVPLTQAQWEAYIDANPRVRVQLAARSSIDRDGTFFDDGFLDDRFLTLDIGPQLYGRRATLRMTRTSPDIDLQLITVKTSETLPDAVEFEQVVIPADKPLTFALDDGFYDDGFVEADETMQRIYSYSLDRQYLNRTSEAWLNTLSPGFQPRDTTYERVSDIGSADPGFYADGVELDDCFYSPDIGATMLADVLYLHNPDVSAPQTGDSGFLDDGYYDFERFRAEMRISIDERAEDDALFLDDGFIGAASLVTENDTRRNAVIAAIHAARAKRDKVMVTFQNYRPLTLGDSFRLGDGVQIGKPIPYAL